jgi:DNA-binding MarR family transcriptional regulator
LTELRPSTGVDPDVDVVWSELTHLVNRISHLLDLRLQEAHQLLLSDFDLMWAVQKAPGHQATMSQLGQSAAMSASGVTRAVDRLVAEGLLTRDRRWVGDRRRAYVRLTTAGAQRLREARETYASEIRGNLDNYLDTDTRARLRILLDQIG